MPNNGKKLGSEESKGGQHAEKEGNLVTMSLSGGLNKVFRLDLRELRLLIIRGLSVPNQFLTLPSFLIFLPAMVMKLHDGTSTKNN